MASYVVALDQSTSATKALLFDGRGLPRHQILIEHKSYYPKPGWVEQDAEEILANTREAVARVVRESGVEAESVAALAITNQRETVVAWDERSGRPVYRAIVWQDERGIPYCERLVSSMGNDRVKAKTGLIVDSYFSASKLQWLLSNEEPARAAAREGRLLAGTIDTWLIWNLTGGSVFATDFSNASRTLLFDIAELRWDSELIEAFSLQGVRLPEVRPSDAAYGAAAVPGLPAPLPIVGVMGDSHAALFGEAGFDPGSGKATYGTGSSIMVNAGTAPLPAPEGIVASIGWGFGGEVSYVFEGNVHSTGDTIRWVRDNLGLFADYREAERVASQLADNGGVYLVPAFSGLGAPHWVHGVRATISGLSRASGRAQIIRAALESIAFQVSDVIARMAATGRVTVHDLRVDGGATANGFLMQFQADLLGVPLHLAPIAEVSSRGVAFAAGVRRGLWDGLPALRQLAASGTTYRPEMPAERREELLSAWHRAVKMTIGT